MKRLSARKMAAKLSRTLRIKRRRIAIDCSKNPRVPQGSEVEKNINGGILRWNKRGVGLFLARKQKGKGFVSGKELIEASAGVSVLNANVLDYLMDHKDKIPKSWKNGSKRGITYVMFLGTIYRESCGYEYVRSLYWDGKDWNEWRWYLYIHWHPFGCNFPIAVLKPALKRRDK